MKWIIVRRLRMLLILTTVLLNACNIYEDTGCGPLHVDFKYDYNMSYQNLFRQECKKIELFIFDDHGVLIKRIIEESDLLEQCDYKMPVRLNPGNYTFMVWAGDLKSYTLNKTTIGVTSLNEMTLDLKHTNHLSKEPLEPLWNGTPLSVSVRSGYGRSETINLIKNTNRLNISLHSMNETFNAHDIAIEVKCANGSYYYDNSQGDKSPITYRPYKSENKTEQEAMFEIDLLRIVKGVETKLRVINKKTGQSMLPMEEIDLVDFLLKTKPHGMSDQEYLDREDTWNFSLYTKQNFIAVMIQINDWIVWSQDDEL